jgi:hypothetical protein
MLVDLQQCFPEVAHSSHKSVLAAGKKAKCSYALAHFALLFVDVARPELLARGSRKFVQQADGE